MDVEFQIQDCSLCFPSSKAGPEETLRASLAGYLPGLLIISAHLFFRSPWYENGRLLLIIIALCVVLPLAMLPKIGKKLFNLEP